MLRSLNLHAACTHYICLDNRTNPFSNANPTVPSDTLPKCQHTYMRGEVENPLMNVCPLHLIQWFEYIYNCMSMSPHLMPIRVPCPHSTFIIINHDAGPGPPGLAESKKSPSPPPSLPPLGPRPEATPTPASQSIHLYDHPCCQSCQPQQQPHALLEAAPADVTNSGLLASHSTHCSHRVTDYGPHALVCHTAVLPP